jgi:arylsulfatase
MEVYAAMVTAMDRAVGRVVAALEERGALEETLVLFLSDNGASAEELRGAYRLAPLFLPIPERTADGRQMRVGDEPSIVPGPADTFSTYGRGWAHLSNTPLRRYKHWTHEGGIAAPFFAHWPDGLAGREGAVVHAPAHVIDVAATLLAIAGDDGAGAVATTGDEGGAPSSGGDSQASTSLLPLLRGEEVDARSARGEEVEPRALFWEHEGNRAILRGRWKLVSRWPRSWELYDVEADRFETTDLAASDPDRVAALDRDWEGWASAVGVEAWPMVVPEVRTAISIAGALLFVLFSIARTVRARRVASRGPRPAPRDGDPRRGDPRRGDRREDPRPPPSASPAPTRGEPARGAATPPSPATGRTDRPRPIVPR